MLYSSTTCRHIVSLTPTVKIETVQWLFLLLFVGRWTDMSSNISTWNLNGLRNYQCDSYKKKQVPITRRENIVLALDSSQTLPRKMKSFKLVIRLNPNSPQTTAGMRCYLSWSFWLRLSPSGVVACTCVNDEMPGDKLWEIWLNWIVSSLAEQIESPSDPVETAKQHRSTTLRNSLFMWPASPDSSFVLDGSF